MIEHIEKVIRRRWLYIFIISCLSSFSFIAYNLYYPFSASKMHFDSAEIMATHLLSYCFVSVLYLFFSWASFYFPYRKKGVKFLGFQLLMTVFFGSYSMIKSGISFYDSHNKWFLLIGVILNILMFYHSINLFIVNLLHKFTSENKAEKALKIINHLKKRYRRYC